MSAARRKPTLPHQGLGAVSFARDEVRCEVLALSVLAVLHVYEPDDGEGRRADQVDEEVLHGVVDADVEVPAVDLDDLAALR